MMTRSKESDVPSLTLPTAGETERLTRSVAVLKNLTIFKKMLKTEQLGLRLVKPLDNGNVCQERNSTSRATE